jgi:hypothetical protein
MVVVSLASPLHVGIYEDHRLIHHETSHEQTSEVLPLLFEALLERYEPKRLFFARGPGSFMSIKISYIFLKTLSIALGVPLFASDGFTFNEGRPIKAMRNLYFVKDKEAIHTQTFDTPQMQEFTLPKVLNEALFSTENEPLYMLPAV